MNTPMFIREEHNHKERQISFFTHLKHSLSVCVAGWGGWGGGGNSWKINVFTLLNKISS